MKSMQVGDLIRLRNFPDEAGIIIAIHGSGSREEGTLDVLFNTGEISVCLDPGAFEVING